MKVVIYVTFLLKLLLRPLAAAASSCPAKQYSGKFQAKDDYVNNTAIIGHSYKNLTIKYAQECFSYCVSDCKCLSYQIFSGTRCELLDEDQNTTTIQQGMFGYKHYQLKQHFKASGGSCPSGCRNGCCQSNPCMNGGTCVETCQNIKQKFKCTCPFGVQGKYCQLDKITSCAVIPGNPKSGVYEIIRPSLTSQFKVYCDFTSEPNYVWTLVESFEYSKKSDYLNRKFHDDHPVKESSPNWIDYRLPLEDMKQVRTNATHWRVTCNFNSADISTTDYVRVDMKTVDVMQSVPDKCYQHIGFLRLEGTTCTENCKTKFETNRYHPFFDPCRDVGCNFVGCGSGRYEAFGAYEYVSEQHDCSSSSNSTTSYWFGYKLN